MTGHGLRRLALVLLVAAAACRGPVVQSPLTGQSRYLCCNLRYEKPVITDNPYQVGTLIPVGTRVEILEVRTDSVKFRPEGHQDITIVEKYGRKVLPFDQFVSRIFVDTDPRTRLQRATPRARGKRRGQAEPASSRLQLVEQGIAQPGMTREEVIMALGYPPANRTPSLDASEWHYWKNRWDEYTVVFEGDRVARVAD
jgi:hypothetical protein